MATNKPKMMKQRRIAKSAEDIPVKSIFVCHANSPRPAVTTTVPPTARITDSVE